jgi:hypothetical protein
LFCQFNNSLLCYFKSPSTSRTAFFCFCELLDY